MSKLILLIIAATFLGGCVVAREPYAGDPYYLPVIPASARVPETETGSLFQAGFGLTLYGDEKAHQIGDIITVQLNERTVSSKSSSTSVTKDNEISFNEDDDGNTILGTNPSFKNLSFESNLTQEREFEGEADSDQSNSLQGSISVTIADILPNGNLVVRGEKWIMLNQGEEYIRVSGIVRPQDVTPQNTISSNRLADARISYGGKGPLAESQVMGFLTRFFYTAFWPF